MPRMPEEVPKAPALEDYIRENEIDDAFVDDDFRQSDI